MKELHVLALGLALTGFVACTNDESASRSVRVEGGYRFPAEPPGIDSPVGECVVCHSLEKGGPLRVAPTLWGIVGDKKARFRWFGYSPALAGAGGNWTEKELDAYLADPNGYLPGTTKTLTGIGDSDERAELIAFLGTLGD